jgi:hypothetical protein
MTFYSLESYFADQYFDVRADFLDTYVLNVIL